MSQPESQPEMESQPQAESPIEPQIEAQAEPQGEPLTEAQGEPGTESQGEPQKKPRKKKPFQPKPPDEIRTRALEIAEQLGEPHYGMMLIDTLIRKSSLEFVEEVLKAALECEANGGMMVHNGSRRRTPGGVFFYMAKGRLPPEIAGTIFIMKAEARKRQRDIKKAGRKPNANDAPSAAGLAFYEIQEKLPPFSWDERATTLQPVIETAHQGELLSMKCVLIGRPTHIERRQHLVVISIQDSLKQMQLPKGVPPIPENSTRYVVYVSAKQWDRVEAAAADPEDALIIEGVCSFDEAVNGMAVFTTSITSKKLDIAKREAKKAAQAENHGEGGEGQGKPDKEQPQAEKPPKRKNNFNEYPSDVAVKLRALHQSAEMLRQRIAGILAQPPNKQVGLTMTQKMLKNIEDEMAQLQAEHAPQGDNTPQE